ncbi:LytTR family transcriptional regulator [Chryseobacterium sp. cx-311]|nr:LytTR family DNA-binding domain-containing protein [Marnyiella aurantia]MBP0611662.1 LytTR family transcriptional regulator [Marnyiella aurantia]
MRVHRSHIINTTFVASYYRNGEVVLNDGTEIEVSATYKEAFLKLF